jgi:hypothetical protein
VTSSNDNPPPPPAEPTGGRPDCPHCQGMGFIVPDVPPTHPDFGRAVVCSCRAAEQEKARAERLLELSQLGPLESCTFASFLAEGIGLTPAKQRNLERRLRAGPKSTPATRLGG